MKKIIPLLIAFFLLPSMANATEVVRQIAQVQTQDTIHITADSFEACEYGRDNDWFIALYSIDSTYFVCFDYISQKLSGTFTLKDMIAKYSWIQIRKSNTYIDYKSVTLTVRKNKDKSVDLHANILGSDDKVYIIKARHVPQRAPLTITPKDTITYTFSDAELNLGNISFQIHTADKPEAYFSTIIYYDGLIEGTYTEDDTAPYGACLRFVKTRTAQQGDNTITIHDTIWVDAVRYDLTVKQQNFVYQADAEMIGNDSILYRIHLTSRSLTPKRTVDIAIHNMTIENLTATQGIFYLDGFNKQHIVSVQVTADAIADGEYTSDLIATVTDSTGHSTQGWQTTLTMTTEAKSRYVKIHMLGKDTVLYRIDMGYVIPTPTDTVSVPFMHSCELTHAKAAGNYQFYNRDSRYIAAIDIHTDTLGGTFTGDAIDKYYSFLGVIRERDTLGVRVMDAKVVLSQVTDTTFLAAEIIGDDSVMYRVTMFYVPPVAKDTMVLNIPHAQYKDLLAQGAYQLHGYTPDSTYYISVTPFTETAEGTFTVSDMYSKYSYIARFDSKDRFTRIPFYSGAVTASLQGRHITMTGGIMGRDSIFYKVNMSALKPLPYDSVSDQAEFAYSTQDEVTANTAYLADSSMILFDAVSYGTTNTTYIRFNTTTTDPVTLIPTGVYPIDDSRKPGTVLAGSISTDKDGNPAPAPSFFARTLWTGQIVPPLYFMVEGTVSVENRNGHLYIEVNARNSYGRPIHITYNSDPTPVDNITTPAPRARKVLRDGQVLIQRDDKTYTITGTEVK